jgi:hypothetical protein
MELSYGEEVQSLTIWLSKEGEFREVRGLAQGRVVAIKVDTTHNQSKVFQPHGTHQYSFDRHMRHEYQSGAHDDLVCHRTLLPLIKVKLIPLLT